MILLSVAAFAIEDIVAVRQEETKYLEDIKQKLDENTAKITDLEQQLGIEEEPAKEPNLFFLFYLLGFNLLLIIFVIVLIVFVYRKYIKQRYGIGEIHPVPKELIDFAYNSMLKGKKLADIRMELAEKGWEPSMIEHAVDAAKEK